MADAAEFLQLRPAHQPEADAEVEVVVYYGVGEEPTSGRRTQGAELRDHIAQHPDSYGVFWRSAAPTAEARTHD